MMQDAGCRIQGSGCKMQDAGCRFLRLFCLHLTPYFFLLTFNSLAQSEIPIGTWRMHLSYQNISSVALGNDEVYGAGRNGILIFDKEDKSLTSYDKLNSLSSSGITHIAFSKTSDQLLVAYEDGTLDIIAKNEITSFTRLKDSNTITGSKKINHISIRENLAYLSADFGLVVFDLQQLEIKETWRDLGPSGEKLPIIQSTFLADSIVLATKKGLMIGNLSDNLLDFKNWKRFDAGDFSKAIASVGVTANKLYAAIDSTGIFRYTGGNFVKESFLQNTDFHSISGGANNLLIVESVKLWSLNSSGQLVQVADDAIVSPQHALEDESGAWWIADRSNGLVTNITGDFTSYRPNGPSAEKAFNLEYADNKIFALPGGFSPSGVAFGNKSLLDQFSEGLWKTENTSLTDLTDVAFFNNKFYVSSFGKGIQQRDETKAIIIYDDSNSPLENVSPPGKAVNISAVETSENGLWVANYGASKPLHLLKTDNTWQSFSFGSSLSRYITRLAIDFFGNVWMVIDPEKGGGILVFDPRKGSNVYIDASVNTGGLPNQAVRSITSDRDGNIWVGTDAGVAYFFSANDDAIKPIFENRFLLKDEKITAIIADGGNRKWIGTERGAWLVNASGEELIHHFTAENSPLLSDRILDIAVHPETGEVFFATDQGIISYRADATSSEETFQSVKIFPNPVTTEFSGTVGITGLATDALVKITDVSGKLIWQTQSSGGTATWNVQDYNGKRAETGIYLVFAATQDGSQSVVGKIAVVE